MEDLSVTRNKCLTSKIMKKLLFRMWPMVLAVLLVSCSEVLAPNGLSDQALSAGTKSPDAEYYYWYEGKRIGLILNDDYVNILVDTNIVNKHNFSELCSEMDLEAKTDLDSYGLFKAKINKDGSQNLDYQKTIEALRHIQ